MDGMMFGGLQEGMMSNGGTPECGWTGARLDRSEAEARRVVGELAG